MTKKTNKRPIEKSVKLSHGEGLIESSEHKNTSKLSKMHIRKIHKLNNLFYLCDKSRIKPLLF